MNPHRGLADLRYRAAQGRIPCLLTEADWQVLVRFVDEGGKCPWCHNPLKEFRRHRFHRLDPERGYELGNVLLTCLRCALDRRGRRATG